MSDVVATGLAVDVLLGIGAVFLLLGSMGLVRMPDVYNRLHTATKSTTLGASSVLLAAAFELGFTTSGVQAVVGIVFLYLTAPVGAHVISRAAERFGIEFFTKER